MHVTQPEHIPFGDNLSCTQLILVGINRPPNVTHVSVRRRRKNIDLSSKSNPLRHRRKNKVDKLSTKILAIYLQQYIGGLIWNDLRHVYNIR